VVFHYLDPNHILILIQSPLDVQVVLVVYRVVYRDHTHTHTHLLTQSPMDVQVDRVVYRVVYPALPNEGVVVDPAPPPKNAATINQCPTPMELIIVRDSQILIMPIILICLVILVRLIITYIVT
jgi:hypothetical protein